MAQWWYKPWGWWIRKYELLLWKEWALERSEAMRKHPPRRQGGREYPADLRRPEVGELYTPRHLCPPQPGIEGWRAHRVFRLCHPARYGVQL